MRFKPGQRNRFDTPEATPETASPALTTPETALVANPAPNIKFCGRNEYDRQKRKVIRANDPIEAFRSGDAEIKLPPADFQKRRRLFYHESAALIARLFPHLYKKLKKRG